MSLRFFALGSILMSGFLIGQTQSAQAGFNFVPAPQKAEIPVPTKSVSRTEPLMMEGNAMAVPAAPVISEPLAPNAPMAMNNLEQGTMAPKGVEYVPAPVNQGALVIDPYPLTANSKDNTEEIIVSTQSVERALHEEGQDRHAMPLGRHMSTMTKPVRISRQIKEVKRPALTSTALSLMPGQETMEKLPLEKPAPKMAEAVGFGKDLPVALALSQVVPADYAYSFADDEVAGKSVSWNGGKPWDQVLNDMLEPHGYEAVIQDKKVIITSKS